MERASKLFVLVWACLALAVEVWLVARGWGQLLPLAIAVILSIGTLAWFDRRVVGVVLVVACVSPVLIRANAGSYVAQFDVLWLSGLLAVVVPDGLRRPWHIPAVWRGPLVCGSLAVAVTTPILCWRELDFTAALLANQQVSNSVIGGAPPYVVSWIVHVALVLVLGVLWFDWLCGLDDARLFRRSILLPLGGSAAAMMAVAVYQLFGHVLFLNETAFGAMGRASGTVLDGNVCGMAAALSLAGIAIFSQAMDRGRVSLVAGGYTLAWLTIWASGSRTAFAVGLVVTASACWTFYTTRSREAAAIAWPLKILGLLAALAVVAAVAVTVWDPDGGVVGPLRRQYPSLPTASVDGVIRFAIQLWNRDQYGAVSTRMIREFPLFGVGVGSFHLMTADYGTLMGLSERLPPDNAQNWIRHQVAELGVVGSAGWLVWTASFAWFVVRGRTGAPPSAVIARAALFAFGLVSLVGMPGQDALVALLFWTLVFWYASLAQAIPRTPSPLSWQAWAVVAFMVVAQAGGTAASAVSALRVPHRAQRVGWPYSYGLYEPEPSPGGGYRRWTGRRAVAVIDAPTPSLEVTVEVNHADISRRPVAARVWCDDQLVVDALVADARPLTRVVPLPGTPKRVVIQTEVSRTARPRDHGLPDDRDLGLLMSWRPVPPASPPAAARDAHGQSAGDNVTLTK